MSSQNPYLKYRQSQIATAPKLKLIVMLYDGAIRFLMQSIPPMLAADYENKGKMINKAISILCHLNGTLDFEKGGSLAVNLQDTYQLLVRKLVDANFRNDPKTVNEVISHLRDLREAWNIVSNGTAQEDVQEIKSQMPQSTDLSLSLAA